MFSGSKEDVALLLSIGQSFVRRVVEGMSKFEEVRYA